MSWFPTLCEGLTITDGAWGTELQKRGLPIEQSADHWNLTRPSDVQDVARSYVESGSRVILTNTFRANAVTLGSTTTRAELFRINRRGAELSRSVAGPEVRVFASMGPTGRFAPTGEFDTRPIYEAFREQAEALAAGGADAILLETFDDLQEACLGVRAVKPTGLPVIVSFAFFKGENLDLTFSGVSPEAAAIAMANEGADAVGANCGAGPEASIGICRRLKTASKLPVWIKPNAGLPRIEAGVAVYTMTPETFAGYLPELERAGASFVGGCCGTDARFIRALVSRMSTQARG